MLSLYKLGYLYNNKLDKNNMINNKNVFEIIDRIIEKEILLNKLLKQIFKTFGLYKTRTNCSIVKDN